MNRKGASEISITKSVDIEKYKRNFILVPVFKKKHLMTSKFPFILFRPKFEQYWMKVIHCFLFRET